MPSETWRVVLATGEVREVAQPECARGEAARVHVVREAACWKWPVAEILAPGELTRAELAAQLAAVTAERDAEAAARYLAQKDRNTQTDALGHALATLRDSVLAALGAQPHEDAAEVAQRVIAERDVALGQIGPLLDAHDALVAAARAAGWTGAGATGAELVAAVRRGEREACAALCADGAEDEKSLENFQGAWALRHAAKMIRARGEGGE